MRLQRSDVLAGAIRLLDAVGVEELTMRKLAGELGVQNGATYWHFPSKQTLLDAIAENLVAGLVDRPLRARRWDRRLAELAGRFHTALLAHRDGAVIYSAAFIPEPASLAYGETMIGILRGAGLGDRAAVWAQDTITGYVVAHAIEHQAALRLVDRGAAIRALTAATRGGDYPNLAQVARHIPAPHPSEHFEFGLRLILSGVDRLRAATVGTSRAPR